MEKQKSTKNGNVPIPMIILFAVLTVGAIALFTAGCGKKDVNEASGVAVDSAEEAKDASSDAAKEVSSDNAADSSKGQENSTSEAEADASIQIVNHLLSCEANGEKLAEGRYPEIIISDELSGQYPKLKETLSEQNAFWKNFAESAVSEYGGYKMIDERELDTPYYMETAADVLRADDSVFAVLEYLYDYSGGAHPNHLTESINIDPVTGKRLEIQDVLKDSDTAAGTIKDVLYETFPDMTDEFDSFIYFTEEESDVVGAFKTKISNDTFTWSLVPEGLKIFFSPYEIASYASGDFEILLPYDKYPELVQPAYIPNEAFDKEKEVSYSDGILKQVEVSIIENTETVTVANKSWNAYTEDGRGPDDGEHVTISKVKEEKTDWLDTEKWASKNGFETAKLPYTDDQYYYVGTNPMEYEYMKTGLEIYDAGTDNLRYSLDLYTLCNGPDEETERYSVTTQFIRWAKIYDGTLYVSVGHNGYASVEPCSSYIVAIAPDTGDVLWKSEPLVSNAYNFQIVKDTIICGYGFTAEDDFIYLLDRFTGQQMDKIKVNSGPDQFEVVGDTLYVATYNTAYEFKIE